MAHIVETFQAGQTVFGLAHGMFGEEYDRLVDTYGRAHITVAVVDTNILINDVKYSLLAKPLTSLMEAARIGALKLFASTTVRDEVWEKLGDGFIPLLDAHNRLVRDTLGRYLIRGGGSGFRPTRCSASSRHP